jgi:prefoldin subunit 5
MSLLRVLAVVLSAAVICCSVCGQEFSAVSSAVSEVTVYPDRARVTRTAMASLPIGTSVLEFSGLPAALDERSVEVSAKADAPLTIEGIDVRQEFLAASANPKAQDLERQLQELQDQQKSLRGQKGVCEEKRQFFRNLSAGLGKGEKEPMNLDDIRKLYTFYGDEVASLSENILSIERSETKLDPEIDRVKRELDSAVFLKVHLVNTSDAQLLPGQVSVFRDGEFTGMLTMNLVPSGSDFDLYAGKDDSIKVERKELVNKRSETGRTRPRPRFLWLGSRNRGRGRVRGRLKKVQTAVKPSRTALQKHHPDDHGLASRSWLLRS